MTDILNVISTAAAFVFGVGIIYLVFDATVGKLKILHSKFEWNGLQFKDFAFLIIAAIILLSLFSFIQPYRS